MLLSTATNAIAEIKPVAEDMQADKIRMSVCRILETRHGKRWYHSTEVPPSTDDEIERLDSCALHGELGHLVVVARAPRIGNGLSPTLKKLLVGARDVRNQLAHYPPLSFETFSAFWETLNSDGLYAS